MATRATYRTNLKSKLLALEDGGYGDFDYEDTDLNLFLAFAVSKLYPAVYTKVKQSSLTLTKYGSQSLYSVTPTYPERVFLLEDAVERTPVLGWLLSGTDIVNIDISQGAGTGSSNIGQSQIFAGFCFGRQGVRQRPIRG